AVSLSLDDITDVNEPNPNSGDILTFDGTNWVNQAKDYYTKTQSDNKYEVLANKATDFSTINNTKYPTTKAVNDNYLTLDYTKNVLSPNTYTGDFNAIPKGNYLSYVPGIAANIPSFMQYGFGVLSV